MRRLSLVLFPAVLSFLPACASGQPHMHAALDDLRAARRELEQAEANKGGHRERALQQVDAAIKQVEEGIEFARH